MSRYIDADALDDIALQRGITRWEYKMIESVLFDFPTADVVEVVRCKDCTRQMICFHSDDYFCADGERRKE